MKLKDDYSKVPRRDFLNSSIVIAGSLMTFPAISFLSPEQKLIEKQSVVFGLNLPTTGFFGDEGMEQLKGYLLAAEHINNGGGVIETMSPIHLNGKGVLGKKVTFKAFDSQTCPKLTQQNSIRLVDQYSAVALFGGSGSVEAKSQLDVAIKYNRIYMGGICQDNSLTSTSKEGNVFRYFFNSFQGAKALSPFLARVYGKRRRAFHITRDYAWSQGQQSSIQHFTELQGWTTAGAFQTYHKQHNYEQAFQAATRAEADVIVLNLYGRDLKTALKTIRKNGLNRKRINDRKMQIVIPFYTELLAKKIGLELFEGIYTPMNWHPSANDKGSVAFTNSFVAKFMHNPTQLAHNAYIQTIVYADAVEKAGSFDSEKVLRTLKNTQYSGLSGHTDTFYRGSDRQAFHDLYLGLTEKETFGFSVNMKGRVSSNRVKYDDKHKLFVTV